MKISNLSRYVASGVCRVEARVTWEDRSKPDFNLFCDGPASLCESMVADPNAFLIACVLVAWQTGERRIMIDGYLCPVLLSNLRIVMDTLNAWYPAEFPQFPTIESSKGLRSESPRGSEAASLLSCGIDSLATLRFNTQNFPMQHPSRIRSAILIAHDDDRVASLERLSECVDGRLIAARAVTANVQVSTIPVRTNIWWLVEDGYFYDQKWHGAILSAIAVFFSSRNSLAYIASGRDSGSNGSHPMIDPHFSSAHFRIEHHGRHLSRLEKTALVADWKVGLQNIRVCQNDSSGTENCGTCGKCIETMLALLVLGKLSNCSAFSANDVSADLIKTIVTYQMINAAYKAKYYIGLVPMLERIGRTDLTSVIHSALAEWERRVHMA